MMSGKLRPKFLLKTFIVAFAVGGGTGPGGCACDDDPEAPVCAQCQGEVSRCYTGGNTYTSWDCTATVNTFCVPQYGGTVQAGYCEGYAGGGTDGTDGADETGDGDVTGAGADDGVDVTGAEEDWTPDEHIEAGTEPGHFDVTEAFAEHAVANQGLLLVGDGTIAFLDGDGCVDIDVAGALPTAMGLAAGDSPRRANGLSLHEDDIATSASALASETDFSLAVESSAPRAWFVRPRVISYPID